MFKRSIGLAALILAASPAPAQESADPPIASAARAEVVRTLGEQLREVYVFPEIAETTAAELQHKADSGAYREYTTSRSFADALRTDLREAGNDRHLQVRYDPSFTPMPQGDDGDHGHDPAEMEQMHREMAENGYGIYRTAQLPGNVGYLDVRFFGPTEFVASAFESALHLLEGSRAIIVDLRSNGGGDPDSVAQLASHFFAKGDERHLNSIYNRPENTTRDFWTVRSVETRFTGPVYVLTSDYTFSGGEEFAYDMQTQKRATLVGETTGGGANPGGPVGLGHGFYAFIPTGRAINPVTGTNWEHVGVRPEHAVPAGDALATAYGMALREAAASAKDEGERKRLEDLAGSDMSEITELPRWKHPRGK
ncbi:S41 family peptidase [Erythrobacter sp. SD-21]|uniref:S41 family peptidase n=1 Tax=Erythrobacter sp. SD-21 TaxID=161528 RepID=UPI000153F4B6|nr:S41 family peptidase [Erythrobacter sp. SD-21]EDL49020.1 hypothetical protein ED21_24856 [Erythrobacter sp. SD-21]